MECCNEVLISHMWRKKAEANTEKNNAGQLKYKEKKK